MTTERNALPKGYIVWHDTRPDSKGNRWRFTTPGGDYDSPCYPIIKDAQAAAWVHANQQDTNR